MSVIDQEIQLTQELEQLLSEGLDNAHAREQAAFDDLAGPFARDLELFGAGNLGRRTLGKLREQRIEPLALLDNSSARWGTTIESVPGLVSRRRCKPFRNQGGVRHHRLGRTRLRPDENQN